MSVKTKKQIKQQTVKQMKELNTYHKEFDQIVDIYCGMLHQYQVFEEMFEQSNYTITEEYTNKAGATNQRKVPLLTAMESLRKDIASYSDRLCLNAKSHNVDVTPKPQNTPPQTEQSKSVTLNQFLAKQG